LEQVDNRIDGLWRETYKLGELAGMSRLRAAAWSFNMVRRAKQIARAPQKISYR
jgi:hypothetical protein